MLCTNEGPKEDTIHFHEFRPKADMLLSDSIETVQPVTANETRSTEHVEKQAL